MSNARLTLLRLAALALGGAAAIGVAMHAATILEARSQAAIATALAEQGYAWVDLDVDGLQATLVGEAPDEVTRFRALTVAGNVVNPANLRDAMHVAAPEDMPAPPYRVEILSSDGDVMLHGLIPGGAEARRRLIRALGAQSPDGNVSDFVTAVEADPSEDWLALMDMALDTVGILKNARVVVTQARFEVAGLTANRVAADALEKQLAGDLPADVALSLDLKLPRPVISPFITRFRIDEDGARFETCAADSEDGKARIENAARAAGATGPFACVEGLGAPDPRWSRAVADGLIALQRLGRGTITFSDLTVTLVGPFEATERVRDGVVADLKAALPPFFQLDVLTPDQADRDTGDTLQPAFWAARSPEGIVILRGQVSDAASEETIESFARARLRDGDLHLSLMTNQDLPAGWQVGILAGIDALARLRNGAVSISAEGVRVYGVTEDPEAETGIAQALSAAFGPETRLDMALSYREKVIPPEQIPPAPTECVDRINEILEVRKISFAPGSVDLDADGLVTVGQIAGVMDECDGVEMEIGGHTDAQGGEEMNAELSRKRAEAVLNALRARQVLTANLTAHGYGEAEPIADNGTEAGREENRRIAFRLTGASAERAAAAADDGAASPAEGGGDAEASDGTGAVPNGSEAEGAVSKGAVAEDAVTGQGEPGDVASEDPEPDRAGREGAAADGADGGAVATSSAGTSGGGTDIIAAESDGAEDGASGAAAPDDQAAAPGAADSAVADEAPAGSSATDVDAAERGPAREAGTADPAAEDVDGSGSGDGQD